MGDGAGIVGLVEVGDDLGEDPAALLVFGDRGGTGRQVRPDACFRWKVKSGCARRLAYQLVGRPEVPLHK